MKNNLIDLYREYVRCADMCDEYNEKHKTNIQPRECVQLKSATGKWVVCFSLNEPDFFELLDHKIRFAVAVIDGRPVFVGDTVYSPEGIEYRADEDHLTVMEGENEGWNLAFEGAEMRKFTRDKPKKPRTFTLNGVELPCPEKEQSEHKVAIHISGSCRPTFPDLRIYFKTGGSACDFYNGLRKILLEAKNKE